MGDIVWNFLINLEFFVFVFGAGALVLALVTIVVLLIWELPWRWVIYGAILSVIAACCLYVAVVYKF